MGVQQEMNRGVMTNISALLRQSGVLRHFQFRFSQQNFIAFTKNVAQGLDAGEKVFVIEAKVSVGYGNEFHKIAPFWKGIINECSR